MRIRGVFFTALLVLMSNSMASADLIGYWPLDGDATDLSSNGLDGEAIGDLSFVDDVPGALGSGKSLLLNTQFTLEGGVDQDTIIAEDNAGYVDLGNPDLLNFGENDFTVAAWMKVPELLTYRGNIFSNGGDNGGGIRYVLAYLETGSNGVVLTTDDNATKRQAQAPLAEFTVDDGDWHHVVGQRSGNELRVYVDGELAAENLDLPEPYDLSGTDQLPAYIGVGADAGSGAFEKFFQGWIDDVAVWDEALSEQQIAAVMNGDFSPWISVGTPGDFNGDGTLDAADIDLLSNEIRVGGTDSKFDVDGDGSVAAADRDEWVINLRHTWYGDADMNGIFNSGDLVAVFSVGEYEDATPGNSTWAEGDWDGNGDFDSGDFVVAFSGGGYEQGERPAIAAVPEPSSFALMLLGLWALPRRRR
ncbi:MAG: PEP-CTERM sorting domain-containing protein [Planctomycetales bacterium]|nr:PEP-CTERM sorting domain-containing protein [Planctomycetales bacterium]